MPAFLLYYSGFDSARLDTILVNELALDEVIVYTTTLDQTGLHDTMLH